MKQHGTSDIVTFPEGVTFTVHNRVVLVRGPRGVLKRDFRHLRVEFERVAENRLRVRKWFGNRKEVSAIKTVCSHIENLIKGVTKGLHHVYKQVPSGSSSNKYSNEAVENLGEERLTRSLPPPESVTMDEEEPIDSQVTQEALAHQLAERRLFNSGLLGARTLPTANMDISNTSLSLDAPLPTGARSLARTPLMPPILHSSSLPNTARPHCQGSTSRRDEHTQTDDYSVGLQRQILDAKRRLEGSKAVIRTLLLEGNQRDRAEQREKIFKESLRIGRFEPTRSGDSFKEVFVDGYANADLHKRMEAVDRERHQLTIAVQTLKKRKPTGKEKVAAPANGNLLSTACSSSVDDGFKKPDPPLPPLTPMEFQEQEEICRLRKEHLKREEADIQLEREKLDREKQLHMRELRRAAHERDSRYKDIETMNERYLLLSLLGKGGFSEVWKAYDLEENRYVACKIHHVNKEWKEEKKANYVKHAMREKDIHKTLNHDRIVRLYDLFTIDNHSFCTVLEYCSGNDLAFYLKQNKQISEKEARSIIMQLVSALMYLAERKPPIIHYDLKPANILLENGNTSGSIKLTDFGLSKVVENSEDDGAGSIELTSQFAGTYWYLPPETFMVGHTPPKISTKVDVWSVGVILHECIYGKRPFGHEQTQQKILEERTIIHAARVIIFPPKPQVSPAALQFMRRCLEYEKENRADIFELANHEFFKFGSRSDKVASSPGKPGKKSKLSNDEASTMSS